MISHCPASGQHAAPHRRTSHSPGRLPLLCLNFFSNLHLASLIFLYEARQEACSFCYYSSSQKVDLPCRLCKPPFSVVVSMFEPNVLIFRGPNVSTTPPAACVRKPSANSDLLLLSSTSYLILSKYACAQLKFDYEQESRRGEGQPHRGLRVAFDAPHRLEAVSPNPVGLHVHPSSMSSWVGCKDARSNLTSFVSLKQARRSIRSF
ncbi:uncharacterized protein LOC119327721 [Triticum dicoccoides]|uniref:uncharacterized protein LOC119327721 n=1 Tax=Triticum dicoccoides TaxID=85692 RepID=UPI001890DC39|nr:uncharacterized protein LOC119327721 [Triticum dicoccoides]